MCLHRPMPQKRNLVGPRVRTARRAVQPKMTQHDLAARLQLRGVRVERAAIAKIETGMRPVTDIELRALAEELGVSVQWLLGLEDANR